MKNTSVRPADDAERVIHTYGNTLFRICLILLGNAADAEDIVQETMIKYLQNAPAFESVEHEKAWLIRVATNKCKDILRFKSRHPVADIDEIAEITEFTKDASDSDILEALMTLPDKFRVVLVLYYVEGYSVAEISRIIGRTESAVKMRLKKGRRLLGEAYRKEYL